MSSTSADRSQITKAEATRKQEEAGEHKEWATYYARKAKREAQWLKNKASAKAKRIKAKSKASEQQRKEKRAQREKERKEREKQEKKARSPPPSDKVAGDGAAPKKPWYRFW